MDVKTHVFTSLARNIIIIFTDISDKNATCCDNFTIENYTSVTERLIYSKMARHSN